MKDWLAGDPCFWKKYQSYRRTSGASRPPENTIPLWQDRPCVKRTQSD